MFVVVVVVVVAVVYCRRGNAWTMPFVSTALKVVLRWQRTKNSKDTLSLVTRAKSHLLPTVGSWPVVTKEVNCGCGIGEVRDG